MWLQIEETTSSTEFYLLCLSASRFHCFQCECVCFQIRGRTSGTTRTSWLWTWPPTPSVPHFSRGSRETVSTAATRERRRSTHTYSVIRTDHTLDSVQHNTTPKTQQSPLIQSSLIQYWIKHILNLLDLDFRYKSRKSFFIKIHELFPEK